MLQGFLVKGEQRSMEDVMDLPSRWEFELICVKVQWPLRCDVHKGICDELNG